MGAPELLRRERAHASPPPLIPLQPAFGNTYPNGFTMTLIAADQKTSLVKWVYLKPSVFAAAPLHPYDGIPAAGGKMLQVIGANFGVLMPGSLKSDIVVSLTHVSPTIAVQCAVVAS